MFNFESMPKEIKLDIFDDLPLKGVLKADLVCHEWNELLKENSIWTKFCEMFFSGPKPKNLRALLVNHFKKWAVRSKEIGTKDAVEACIKLFRLQIYPLPNIEHLISQLHCQENERTSLYRNLASACIKQNKLSQAENYIPLMSTGIYKNEITHSLMRIYLENSHYDHAIRLISVSDSSAHLDRSFTTLIEMLKNANEYDLAIQALNLYRSSFYLKSEVIGECTRVIVSSLMEKGETAKANELQSEFFDSIESINEFERFLYLFYTDKLKEAEAKLFSSNWLNEKKHFWLMNLCVRNLVLSNHVEADRLKTKADQFKITC
jgi:hypothetical protein